VLLCNHAQYLVRRLHTRDGRDLEDITDRKLAEDSLRKAQAELAHVTRLTTMGELAASIAHEVNQPLAAVITNGNASLRWLAGTTPNVDEARAAVQRVIRDGHRVLRRDVEVDAAGPHRQSSECPRRISRDLSCTVHFWYPCLHQSKKRWDQRSGGKGEQGRTPAPRCDALAPESAGVGTPCASSQRWRQIQQ
jgi:hypothetical protein